MSHLSLASPWISARTFARYPRERVGRVDAEAPSRRSALDGDASSVIAMSNALSVSITWDASHFSDNAWSMIVGPARPGVTVSTEAKPWRRARSSGSESGVGGCACKMATARSAAHDANSCGWRMTISETACTAPSAASAISISVCRVDASPERACLKARCTLVKFAASAATRFALQSNSLDHENEASRRHHYPYHTVRARRRNSHRYRRHPSRSRRGEGSTYRQLRPGLRL